MVPELTPGPGVPAARWLELNLNLANIITLARLASVPVTVWLILDERYAAAFWVFVGAGLSDALDGYIAKRFDRRTPLGALLDPIADKALLTAVYLTLGLAGQLPGWLVFLVILRDVLIVLGFIALRASGATPALGPLFVGKLNTLVQIALVGFVLARLGLGAEDGGLATLLLIGIAASTTVLSGLFYLVRLARILTGSATPS